MRAHSSKLVLIVFAQAVFGLTGIGAAPVSIPATPAAAPNPSGTSAACSSAAYRQFDFWIGDWDVTDAGAGATIAHARIEPILGGCVLREDYRPIHGQGGQSLTIYDRSRDLWHQTWVTATGTLLEIDGKLDQGSMIMSGKNQAGALVRGVWRPLAGAVAETAAISTDGGKSWKNWFDLTFRRSKTLLREDHACR